jgi:hypothetical protein
MITIAGLTNTHAVCTGPLWSRGLGVLDALPMAGDTSPIQQFTRLFVGIVHAAPIVILGVAQHPVPARAAAGSGGEPAATLFGRC